MVLLQGVITKGYDNWHRSFKCVNLFFKPSLDGVVFKILFKSEADLSIVIGLAGNFLSLNVTKLSFDPDLLKFFPFL